MYGPRPKLRWRVSKYMNTILKHLPIGELIMDPTKFLGRRILDVLAQVRGNEAVVEYSKIEGDEFLKFPERGFYLHAKNDSGIIFDCRIYLVKDETYFSANDETRGVFALIKTIFDAERKFGASASEIKSIRIPTRPPTLPGRVFLDGDTMIKAFFDVDGQIRYFHVTQAKFI